MGCSEEMLVPRLAWSDGFSDFYVLTPTGFFNIVLKGDDTKFDSPCKHLRHMRGILPHQEIPFSHAVAL